MPIRCTAATMNGHQCRCNARPNQTLCGRHNNPNVVLYNPNDLIRERCMNCRRPPMVGTNYCRHHELLRPRPDLPPEQRCVERHCMRIVHGYNRCRIHEGRFHRREQARVFNDMYRDGLNRFLNGVDTWQDVVIRWRHQQNEPFVNNHILEQLEVTLARDQRIPELWNMYMGQWAPMDEVGQIAWEFEQRNDWHGMDRNEPPRGELEAFIRDGQNVHTRFVTEQTNSALQILLNMDVPPTQKTVLESHMKFMEFTALGRIQDVSLDMIDRVDRDVKRWYRTATCRVQDDYLYKRVLDGLWLKIKTSSVRDELVIRLWQEMVDSVGMCCDGHISRLTNVLCGFDEAFQPELTPGEKLQNRMAVIASMEGGIILQTAHALAAFREFDIPREQWEAWVDAL
jgi:hypothetical protein